MTACVAASGLAVPISMPRYTWAESTLMISIGKCWASSSATALLPEAVGPMMKTAGGRFSMARGAGIVDWGSNVIVEEQGPKFEV